MSATVFDRETIKKSGMKTIRDIDDYSANVSINQIGQVGGTYISIRGIESNPFIINRTAVYVDGIPYLDPDSIRLHNVEQIEVLRGPQGTLYGANTNAGVFVINTMTPSEELNVGLGLSLKSFENGVTYTTNGNISGGIMENLTGLLSFEYEEGDSYIRNISSSRGDKGEIEDLAVSSKFRYEPNDNTRLDLVTFYNDLNAPGLYEQEFPALNADLYNATYAAVNGGKSVDDYELANDSPKKTEGEEWGLGLSFRHEFTDFTLRTSGSYRNEDEKTFGVDFDLTAQPLSAGGSYRRSSTWDFEARLSNNELRGLDWVLGAAYYKDTSERVLKTLNGVGGFDDLASAPKQEIESEDIALFGQLIFPLTEQLNFSAGLRFEHSKRVIQQAIGSLDLGFAVFSFPAVDETEMNNEWIPKISFDYAFNDDVQVYASASKGYLPGGFNLVAANNGSAIADQFGDYGKEELWSYEIGAKGYFFDSRLFATAAVFYIDAGSWQEYNILTGPDGAVLATTLITSNAAIESRGFEAELAYNSIDELTISAGFGYTDAEYSKYKFSANQDFKGNDVKLIPRFDFTLNATYEFANGWHLRGDSRAIGKTSLNKENTATRDSQWIFGLSAGYEIENWSVRAFVKNLTDERYAAGLAYQNFLFGDDGNFYAPLATPRVIGVEVNWEL